MRVEAAAIGYSGLRNDFSTAADRADVHGRPGAADRLRQRREPADRARLHAAEGDRRAALARRVARPAGAAAAGREPGAVVASAARSGVALAVVLTRGLLALVPSDGRPLLIQRRRRTARILAFTLGLTFADRRRLRPAAGAARQPARSVDDAEGHGRRDRRHRRIAVPAQGPGHRAGRAQLPAAVRRRPVRAQPAEPARRPTPASRSTTW